MIGGLEPEAGEEILRVLLQRGGMRARRVSAVFRSAQ